VLTLKNGFPCRWVLKCTACNNITAEVGRIFCPKCGNGGTLYKVSVTVGANGSVHAGQIKRVNLRGTRVCLSLITLVPNLCNSLVIGNFISRVVVFSSCPFSSFSFECMSSNNVSFYVMGAVFAASAQGWQGWSCPESYSKRRPATSQSSPSKTEEDF
jgi:hypothetical protein